MIYDLPAEMQKRLEELGEATAAENLGNEAALCRLLIEQAARSGNADLAGRLVGVLVRLVREQHAQLIRSQALLRKSDAMDFARFLIDAAREAIADLPDQGERTDRLVARLNEGFALLDAGKENPNPG